jgi:hypothetical protein
MVDGKPIAKLKSITGFMTLGYPYALITSPIGRIGVDLDLFNKTRQSNNSYTLRLRLACDQTAMSLPPVTSAFLIAN